MPGDHAYAFWHQFPDRTWETLGGWSGGNPHLVDSTGWPAGAHRFWAGVRGSPFGPVEAWAQVAHNFAP